jgi:hypothetical protein
MMEIVHETSITPEQRYPLDANHVGLRLTVLLTMIVSAALGLFVIMPTALNLLPLTGLPELCLTGVGTLLIGVGVSWGVETALRSIWPSGRVLVMNGETLALRQRGGESAAVEWARRMNVLAWYFIIRRGRTWVPRGWYCAAFRLTQDETVITLYAFIKPEVASQMPQWPAFEELISRKQAPRRGDEHLLAKVGEQAQLRGAERDRWDDGAEMRAEDFAAFVAEIDARVPDWPAARADE